MAPASDAVSNSTGGLHCFRSVAESSSGGWEGSSPGTRSAAAGHTGSADQCQVKTGSHVNTAETAATAASRAPPQPRGAPDLAPEGHIAADF